MANDTAYIAEFAANLWNNYIKQKLNETLQSGVFYYKATVISNPGNGTLNVQRPYDNTINIRCADDLKGVSAGTLVTVLVFGQNNAANHIAISADGMKDIRTVGASDYVIDSGSGNTGADSTIINAAKSSYSWQKWNSGKLEIWGNSQLAIPVQTSTAFNTGYVSTNVLTCWGTWPVAFTSVPVVTYRMVSDEEVAGANYFTCIEKYSLANQGVSVNPKTTSPYFKVWSETQEIFTNDSDYPVIAFYAVGNWK